MVFAATTTTKWNTKKPLSLSCFHSTSSVQHFISFIHYSFIFFHCHCLSLLEKTPLVFGYGAGGLREMPFICIVNEACDLSHHLSFNAPRLVQSLAVAATAHTHIRGHYHSLHLARIFTYISLISEENNL
jgi:hypothetical protein